MKPPEIRPGIKPIARLASHRASAAEADEEIRLHLELRTNQLIAEGLSPSDARAEAERRFGSIEEERVHFQESAKRVERRIGMREWIDSVRQDVRYGARTLRRDLGFTIFAILIVGLGVGACATVFSLINGVLLRPMPFKDPSRLVWIHGVGDDGKSEYRLQVFNFQDLGTRSQSLADIAGYQAYFSNGNAVLRGNDDTQRLTNVPITCNFLPFLGITPILGRSFSNDECLDNSPRTVILTEPLWRTRFAADLTIIGRSITINDQPATVIGVVPATFDFASVFAPGSAIDLFAPYPLTEQTNRQGNALAAIGRLKPGVSVDRARTEIVALGEQITADNPGRNPLHARVRALDERVNGQVRPALLVLAIAVVAVMLIVCANLASLQLARMMARQREMAVRLALGAGRGRLIRQLSTESLMLAGAGALVGLALTVLGTRLVSSLSAFDIPLLTRVHVDGAALGVAALVAIATGMFVGVLPALNAPADVQDALKDGNRGSSHGSRHARIRSALVVTEIATACVLLVASGLLFRSFVHVLDVDLGFRPERTVSVRIDPAKRFPDLDKANVFYDDATLRVRSIPGVTSAALADVLPFAGDRSWQVGAEGQVYPRNQSPEAFIRVVGDGYFGTMGIPVTKGRDFAITDTKGAPAVVVVNAMLARALWPGVDPIGRIFVNGRQRLEVIGVVGDVRHSALEGSLTNEVYFPMRQTQDYGVVNLVVRTSLPEMQLASSVRAALAPIAPEAAKQEWRTLQALIDKAASPRRFVVTLLGGFTLFALILAALGIYALVSYGVNQRTQEIGIRLALGASTSDVRSSIMRGTLVLAGMGIVIGIAASALLVPSLSGMLFGVRWQDPASFATALSLVGLVAAAAGYFPALRASRVDPSVALRG